MTRIELMERSLRCFVWGLFSLLPVLGIPMSIMAVWQYGRVKRGQGEMWNPAERYLFCGTVCARLGLAIDVLILGTWMIFVMI
jgi:hypothetical protein